MFTPFARSSTRRSPSPVYIVALILLALALACGAREAPEEPDSSPDGRGTTAAESQNGNISGGPTPGGFSSSAGTPTGAASRADENPTGAAPGSSSSASAQPAPASEVAAETGSAGTEPVSTVPAAVPIPTRTIPVEEVTWSIQGVFPLHQAAFDGELSEVEALLAQGEPVQARTEMVSSAGETRVVTPIELAVWNNSPEVVEFLIENGGAEPLRHEKPHSILALIAVQHNPDPGVMEVLLKAFPDQLQKDLDDANNPSRALFAWALPCAVAATARYPEPTARFLAFGWDDHVSGDVASIQFCEKNPAGFVGEVVKKNPNPAVLQVFLDHGADINRVDNRDEFSYLHITARFNPEPAVAAFLVDHGSDVNQSDKRGQTPLHFALQKNPEPSVAAVLIARGADVNALAPGARHPLWLALQRNQVNTGLVRLLLEAGADPNATELGSIPLRWVMQWDEPDLSEGVTMLLENGANVNARDSVRMTALHQAVAQIYQAEKGPKVVKLLLDAGADVNAQDQRGITPFHMGLYDVEAVKLLLGAGADINLHHPEHGSLLHLAARAEEGEVLVGLLLDAGADPNGKDPNGDSVLPLVFHRPKVVERLLDGGANVDSRDSDGRTALYLAIGTSNKPGYPETVELLLDRGADPHADAGGRTPCQQAQRLRTPTPAAQRLLELACSP